MAFMRISGEMNGESLVTGRELLAVAISIIIEGVYGSVSVKGVSAAM